MRQVKGLQGRLFRFECRVCGGTWERRFVSRKAARAWVRGQDVCPAGKHVVVGGLERCVRVKGIR